MIPPIYKVNLNPAQSLLHVIYILSGVIETTLPSIICGQKAIAELA
jgi:hypothetical protein